MNVDVHVHRKTYPRMNTLGENQVDDAVKRACWEYGIKELKMLISIFGNKWNIEYGNAVLRYREIGNRLDII